MVGGAFLEHGEVLALQTFDLLGEGAEASHAEAAEEFGRVRLGGDAFPETPGVGGGELVDLLVAGDAAQLFAGEQRVLLVLVVLGNDEDDLLDLGLQEEQGLLDLQLVALRRDQLRQLQQPPLRSLLRLLVVALAHLALQTAAEVFEVGEDLRLQVLHLLLQPSAAVLPQRSRQLADQPQFVLQLALVEAYLVLDGVHLGPDLHQFGPQLVQSVLHALGPALFPLLAAPLPHQPHAVAHLLHLPLQAFHSFAPPLQHRLHSSALACPLHDDAGSPAGRLGERRGAAGGVVGGGGGAEAVADVGDEGVDGWGIVDDRADALRLGGCGQSGVVLLELATHPFLNFLHKFAFFLGLRALGLEAEDFHFFYFVVGDFEFALDVFVPALEQFRFAVDAFCFCFVFLAREFFVETRVVQSQDADVSAHLLHLFRELLRRLTRLLPQG